MGRWSHHPVAGWLTRRCSRRAADEPKSHDNRACRSRLSGKALGSGNHTLVNRQEKHDRKAAVRRESSRVRDILNDWDPIPDSPSDEYDWLVERVVSALHRGIGSETELTDLLCDEFQNHFGLPVGRSEAAGVARRIVGWWTARPKRGPHA